MRAAKPANAPVPKMSKLPTMKAPNVLKKKSAVPLTVASVIPTKGVISGAMRIPKIKKACESRI